MSPEITLALLSVNVVSMACSSHFAQQSATIGITIRTGIAQGVRLSKQHRLSLLTGVWAAPAISELGLSATMSWFNFQIAGHTEFDGLRMLAYLNMFFWSLAVVGALGFGIIDAFTLRAEVYADDDLRKKLL
jgi:hypothetical protein